MYGDLTLITDGESGGVYLSEFSTRRKSGQSARKARLSSTRIINNSSVLIMDITRLNIYFNAQ